MSSMLEQAIIDATALREAAIKSAEQAVVEKYSPEIKEAVEKLMEENDFEENKTMSMSRLLRLTKKAKVTLLLRILNLATLEQE